ncbi:MAG: lycopene cyclase domain-containing protein [Chloroflexi bacterium]|nr:lycopene cyclase domain-containing protein [Chloroflexota bacterium]MCL5273996.1 lycopene cyclase domain-containing protein [Chloroflexota bacterium]
MKYSRFLLIFVAPFVLAGAILTLPRVTKRELLALILLPILAMIWTTPWDNYLVASGVWRYDPSKVWNVILGYVPLEEYLFFVLQSLGVGFPTIQLLPAVRNRRSV